MMATALHSLPCHAHRQDVVASVLMIPGSNGIKRHGQRRLMMPGASNHVLAAPETGPRPTGAHWAVDTVQTAHNVPSNFYNNLMWRHKHGGCPALLLVRTQQKTTFCCIEGMGLLSDALQMPCLMTKAQALQAPMENLADRPARIALKDAVGGFDEACTGQQRSPCSRCSATYMKCMSVQAFRNNNGMQAVGVGYSALQPGM